MATGVTWKVRGIRNQVAGQEFLTVRFKDEHGKDALTTLRPVDGQIRMYLFHTPEDERPTHGFPRPIHLKPNDEAPHFRLYYTLFPSTPPPHVPRFKDHGNEDVATEDLVIAARGGTRKAVRRDRVTKRFLGIRFTCITVSAAG